MMSGMTSPTTIWFRLTLDDTDLAEYYTVKEWLDEVGKRIRTVFAESNFYTSLGTLYEDLGAFGTGVMIMYEDFDDVIRCYNTCAGEYFLANGDRMAIDTLYRMFVHDHGPGGEALRRGQLLARPCSRSKQKGAASRARSMVGHAIEPNDDLRGDARTAGRRSARCTGSTARRASGSCACAASTRTPFIAPRWDVFGNDAYGRGPGMDALGDIKQLQVQQKRKAQAIDKMVNPPLIADVALKNEPASVLPGRRDLRPDDVGERRGFKPGVRGEARPLALGRGHEGGAGTHQDARSSRTCS
jgi:hypothetical protein